MIPIQLPRRLLLVVPFAGAATLYAQPVSASILPLESELDRWSNLRYSSGVNLSYNATTNILSFSGTPSNDLEIGGQFGPSNTGRHYGTGGTLGGPFAASFQFSGVVIDEDGSVTNGGVFSVVHNGSAAGSIGSDYSVEVGGQLLTGSVVEVLLDARGDNTLDVLVDITGGALQNDNPDPNVGVFAPFNRGLLRIESTGLPSEWTDSFTALTASVKVLGLTVLILDGDFNEDGEVDAADYTIWRDGLGTRYDEVEYYDWKDNFGQTSGGGAAVTAIPEPSTLALLIFGCASITSRRWAPR